MVPIHWESNKPAEFMTYITHEYHASLFLWVDFFGYEGWYIQVRLASLIRFNSFTWIHIHSSPDPSICFGSATIERNHSNAGNSCQNRLEPTVT